MTYTTGVPFRTETALSVLSYQKLDEGVSMEMPDLDFLDGGPSDPVERVQWLARLHRKVNTAITKEFQVLYYEARRAGRLDDVIEVSPHSVTQIFRFTRAENEALGRGVRWAQAVRKSPAARL
jgi:hypothetical protein